ncbi:MAG TPA: folate-binding protein, partial [Ramlibacter sp.]|nr:folate-binding protein [Ramlibacter sp.]
MTPILEGASPLPHLGVIRVEGEDSVKFLQSQLTQDVALLGPADARLAAFCNAKGRMQASFIVAPAEPDGFALVMSRDLLPQTLKRLSMFVLRAKARLTDATDAFALLGLAGDAARAAGGSEALAPWRLRAHAGGQAVGLYPAD